MCASPMALPLGKLAILVGAGVVGTVLAQEGHASTVSDFLSGAVKIVWKQLHKDKATPSRAKQPNNDILIQQVNSLRDQLDRLASSRPVTIVTTSSRSGSGKYGIIVIIIVAGYGYVWWKGWKLSDMMFATRRGLNDACASVAKQLETVYSSISATKKHLSSRIDRVDCKIDECADITAATKGEVSGLRGDVKLIGADVQSVHHVVRTLETKISRIEGRQNETNFGVGKLVAFVKGLESSRTMESVEGPASRPALELPPVSPSRTLSLPPNTSLEPPSPSTSNGSVKKQTSFPPSNSSQSTVSASGLKDLHDISDGVGVSGLSTPKGSNGSLAPDGIINDYSASSVFVRRFSGASFLSRSRSAMQSFK